MNIIRLFSEQAWVERLGWTLVHFLWQGVLIAAWYGAARRCAAFARGPNSRYLLACAALAIMAIAPVLTWSLLHPSRPDTVAASFTAPVSAAESAAVRSVPTTVSAGVSRALPAPFLSWVVALWL